MLAIPNEQHMKRSWIYWYIAAQLAIIGSFYFTYTTKLFIVHADDYRSAYGLLLEAYTFISVLIYTGFMIKYYRLIKGNETDKLRGYMLSHWVRWLCATPLAGLTVLFFDIDALYLIFAIQMMSELALIALLLKNKGLDITLLRSPSYMHVFGITNLTCLALMPVVFQNLIAALLIICRI